MEHVARQARQLKRACGKRDAEWGELSNAICELADAVEALPEHDHVVAIKDHLVPLAEELVDVLRNIRSKLVSDACEQLGRIVKTTRLAFAPLANMMLQGLADTAKASSIAIRDPGFRLFSDVSEHSRYDLETAYKLYRNSPQERVRVLLLEQLHTVLTYWPKHEVDPHYNEVLDMMRLGLRDPSSHVRTACRQTFCLFSDLWNERVEELVDVPTQPAREVLLKEKPHATISKAMQRKFGSTPSKATRADSVSALRQQRSAIKRQGSAAGDDAFIEVTDSPRRPLQRSTVEAPKRGVSPARATPRAPSPSAPTRGAVRATGGPRAPSPSSTARSASPGATSRVASPVLGAAQRPSIGGRAASPGRSTQVSSPRVNGNGHASAAQPTKGRLGEFDRYLSLTGQEKTEFNLEEERANGSSISPPREKTQKRVSIAEPTTADPTRTLSFSSEMSSTSFQTSVHATTQPSWRSTASAQDPSRLDSMTKTAFLSDRDSKMPAAASRPSLHLDPAPPSSYTAAAQSFVSQSHRSHHAETASTQIFGEERTRVDDSAVQPPRDGTLSTAREDPTSPARGRESRQLDYSESLLKPDAFLDRPIPSSAPAPEPRASTNVTTRGRRPPSFQSVSRDATESVAAAPVPETQPQVEVRPQVTRPRFLDETFPPPPSASIDSAFLQSNMASAAPAADRQREDPVYDGGDVEDKENNRGGQENLPQKPALKQADAPAMDAISVLGALRGTIRATHEKMEATQAVPPMKSSAPLQPSRPGVSTPAKQQHQAPTQPSFANPGHDDRDDEEKKSAPAPVVQGLQSDSSAKAQPTRAAQDAKPRAQPASTTTNHNPRTTGMQANAPPQQAPTDFIRAPAPFKFAPPQPRQQQPKAPASAPNVRVPASAPLSRPASEPSAFERNGLGGRRNNHHDREMPHQLMASQAAGFRQRQQPREPSPARSSGSASVAESSASHSSDGTQAAFAKRHTVLNPQPQRMPSNVAIKMLYSFGIVLMAIFGLSGLIEAATKVRNAYEYHQSLLDRINEFESSIVESYESVRKMNEKYAVWSEYVRELTDQDETNALHQLESIQTEVEKWQREMKSDLLEFKQSLSGDIIDAALAPLRDSNGSDEKTPAPAT